MEAPWPGRSKAMIRWVAASGTVAWGEEKAVGGAGKKIDLNI